MHFALRGSWVRVGWLAVMGMAAVSANAGEDEATADGATIETTDATGEAPTTDAPRVAYLGSEEADAATRVVEALMLLSPPVSLGEAPVPLGELLPPGQLAAIGVQASTSCAGEPATALTYQSLVDELYRRNMSLEDTARVEADIRAAQACLSEPLPPSALARAAFLTANIRFGEGRLDEADAAFREVFVLDGSFPWDDDYPPEAQVRFAQAMTAVAAGPRATLEVVAVDAASLWVDGTSRDPGAGPLQVPAGRHVVQMTGVDGVVRAVALELAPDEVGLVVDPASLDPGSEHFEARIGRVVAAMQAAEVAGRGSAPDYLVVMAEPEAIHAWDPDAGTLNAVKLPRKVASALSGAAAAPEKRGPGAGPVLIGAGLGAALLGGVLTGVSAGRMDDITEAVEAGEMSYAHPLDPDPTDTQVANRQTFIEARTGAGIGTGLMIAGGVTAAIGIPVSILGKREATVGTTLLWAPAAGDAPPALDGFAITLSIR